MIHTLNAFYPKKVATRLPNILRGLEVLNCIELQS